MLYEKNASSPPSLSLSLPFSLSLSLSLSLKVRNDKLDLRVPVWVNAMDFIPGGGAHPTVAVGTGHHQVCTSVHSLHSSSIHTYTLS